MCLPFLLHPMNQSIMHSSFGYHVHPNIALTSTIMEGPLQVGILVVLHVFFLVNTILLSWTIENNP
jgi:isoprenylcysteine carboxyl methyltransferase (ICMT) family protein YpbQ